MNESTAKTAKINDNERQVVSHGRAALVVAHPSHELRVHGWLELARPLVFILTDGSGRLGEPKLDWTTRVLKQAGATPGCIYGRLTDLEVYACILKRDYDSFIKLTNELAEELVREQIEYIAGDAVEGRNVTHDLARLIAEAAVKIANRWNGRSIAHFDFTVVGRPDDYPAELSAQILSLDLDDDAFERKLAAVRSHHPKLVADLNAALGGQLLGSGRPLPEGLTKAERGASGAAPRLREETGSGDGVLGLLDGVSIEAFREEYLRPVTNRVRHFAQERPFYEAYGEKLVGAGYYQQVIRYREHFAPLAEAIWNDVERGGQH